MTCTMLKVYTFQAIIRSFAGDLASLAAELETWSGSRGIDPLEDRQAEEARLSLLALCQ